MKNLSIFGNFLKSFVFVFLALGVLSSEGFGADTNVALNSAVSQSDGGDGTASALLAVDGLTTTESNTGKNAKHDWFQIDLGSQHSISRIVLIPKNDDSKLSRFNNTWVMISDTAFVLGTETTDLNNAKTLSNPHWNEKIVRAQDTNTLLPTSGVLNSPVNGRYVLIQKEADNNQLWKYIALKEAEVWGTSLVPPTPCNGCDCSLDTDTNDANNPSIITVLDGATTDVTTCLSGISINNENGLGNTDASDYYKFTVAKAGVLKVTTSSPNDHDFHLKIWKDQGTVQYVTANEVYTDGGNGKKSHPVSDINLAVGDIISIYTKETGRDTDEYELNFDFSTVVVPGVYLDNNSVKANLPSGTDVGTLSTVPNSGTYTYNIEEIKDSSGTVIGSTGFAIDVDKLVTGEVFTTGGWFDVTVRSNDSVNGAPQDGVFRITVMDANLSGMNEQDFEVIYTGNAYSKMRILGNSSLCKKGDSKPVGNTSGAGNDNFKCFPGGAGTSVTNNDVDMINNDYDDVNGTSGNGDTTINSSAALLDMPAGKKVLWAGLFWQGKLVESDDAKKETVKNVKFKHQDETSYTDLVSQKTNWISKVLDFSTTVHTNHKYDYFVYQGFFDVTEQVNNNGGGYYWVGDIISVEGNDRTVAGGSYAGWSLTVVYADEDEEMRNTTVYHGYKDVAQGAPVSTKLTGFLTPKEGDVSSELFIFASDGDTGATWSSTLESITVTDKSNTEHKLYNNLNPDGDLFNSTITRDGATVTSGLPYSSPNSLGLDIDSYNVGKKGFIKNAQSETTVKVSSENSDGFYLGTLALETELYVPELCYDYAYSQYGRYLTEDNNGSKYPHIKARDGTTIVQGEPLELKIFVRNEEASDVISTNTRLHLFNVGLSRYATVGTRQAEYILGTTEVTPPNTTDYQARTDHSDTNSSQVNDVYNGEVGSKEFFYAKFDLDVKVPNIDMPINARLNYDIDILDANGASLLDGKTAPVEAWLDETIPLCSSSGYKPNIGEFNVVHDKFYADYRKGSENGFYNLPTQVVGRNGNFHVIATDMNKSNGNENMDRRKAVKTIVGVEIINAGGWIDVKTACEEPTSRRSHVIWMAFQDLSDGTTTNVPLNNTLLTGGDEHYIYSEYKDGNDTMRDLPLYSNAIESAAFRITTFKEVMGILPEFTGSKNSWGVTNLSATNDEHYTGGTNCMDNSNLLVASECKDSGMDDAQLSKCIECLKGSLTTKKICSRDNFAIRPEAFLISIHDINASGINPKITDDNVTGVKVTDPDNVTHMAAGYNYELNVTAVTHKDNNASMGYRGEFQIAKNSFGYVWDSSTPVDCNDTNPKTVELTVHDGESNTTEKVSQVGKYELQAIDTTWTEVDQDPSHHYPDINNTNPKFKLNKDCAEDKSLVQLIDPTHADNDTDDLTIGNTNYDKNYIAGCNISSKHNKSKDANITYEHPKVEFHPYKFDINNTMTLGLNSTPLTGTKDFIYMADINKSDSLKMSVQLNTVVEAQGKDGIALSNFVHECYAEPLNLKINRSVAQNTVLEYKYKIGSADVKTIAYDANISDTIGTIFFPQTENGKSTTIPAHMNYDRNETIVANPENVSFGEYSVDSNASFHADLEDNSSAKGDYNISKEVIHYYGRTNGRKTIIVCKDNPCKSGVNGEPDVEVYYEVYCHSVATGGNQCLYGSSLLLHTDSKPLTNRKWSSNDGHIEAKDGKLTSMTDAKAFATMDDGDGDFTIINTHSYNTTNGLPYTAQMQDIVPSFLWHRDTNKKDNDNNESEKNINVHKVEFRGALKWSGENETNTTTNTKFIRRVNRRTMW